MPFTFAERMNMVLRLKRKRSKTACLHRKSVISTTRFTLLYINGSTSDSIISDGQQLQSKPKSRKEYSKHSMTMITLNRRPSCNYSVRNMNDFWRTGLWKGLVLDAVTQMHEGINVINAGIYLTPWN